MSVPTFVVTAIPNLLNGIHRFWLFVVDSVYKAFIHLLAKTKANMLDSFNSEIFKCFVERIIVYSRTEIGFKLKCGITLRERLVR